MIVVSVTNTLPAGLTCANTLAWHVFANFQGDGIPSKGENCAQRSCGQKLHVSTPTISELLLCMSSIITLQPFSSACAVSSVAVFRQGMHISTYLEQKWSLNEIVSY